MITFEEIINEKDKEVRNVLIAKKIQELNESNIPLEINTNSIVNGFISNESVVYFSDWHLDLNKGLGSLYGMKATDYFYEFFDFLSAKNLTSKIDVINYVSSFLKKYFDEEGTKKNYREVLFDDICNQLDHMEDKDKFLKCRNNWMDIGIFKGKSAAECTEHTIIAQNLLSICDIESCYISGNMKTSSTNEAHAFTIFKMDDEYYLLDSTNPVCLFDEKDNYVGCKSFVAKLSYEKVIEFINSNGEINLNKCNYMRTSDGKIIMVDKSRNVYTTTSKLINEEECNDFFNFSSRSIKI